MVNFFKNFDFCQSFEKKIDFGQIFQNIDFGIFEKMSNLVKISQNFTFSQIYRKKFDFNQIWSQFTKNLDFFRKIRKFWSNFQKILVKFSKKFEFRQNFRKSPKISNLVNFRNFDFSQIF